MRPWPKQADGYLECAAEVTVRFQEVDSMGVVWHGHYLTFFEEGRAAFGREFGQPVRLGPRSALPGSFRYSAVISQSEGLPYWKTLLMVRLYGFRQVKLKLKDSRPGPIQTARRLLGRKVDVRVDMNMAWSVEDALHSMREFSRIGIRSFEQPIAAHGSRQMPVWGKLFRRDKSDTEARMQISALTTYLESIQSNPER